MYPRMRIYLADLVYDTSRTNYVVPLNVAYLAAYADAQFPGKLDIRLFKYPTELERAMKDNPPDMLGLSQYSWNTRLNGVFVDLAKRLNPDCTTMMGGPHMRTEPADMEVFLRARPNLDHYIMFEGEEPFAGLVQARLDGEPGRIPPGVASLAGGSFSYTPVDMRPKPRELDLPSPYLTGWLDPFIADPAMIPLMETNRGCPFKCAYCAWGISALSKVRVRDLDLVFAEMDYVAEKSAGQVNWIFCDANFGLLARDVDIARKLRSIMDERGYPVHIILCYSKNTGARNIEIGDLVGDNTRALVALQSADDQVLKNVGRQNISRSDIDMQVEHYHGKNMEIKTDLIMGLPGESRVSHFNTLRKAFDMGFDYMDIATIRLLPGSRYETDAFRQEYGLQTKFRPIFGAWGEYDGRKVFEYEESVRASKDITEDELNDFKVHHWLIYFAWNTGIFRLLLRHGRECGADLAMIIDQLAATSRPKLRAFFDELLTQSMDEWFDTEDGIVAHYEGGGFGELADFAKLNFLYMAKAYSDPDLLVELEAEIVELLRAELAAKGALDEGLLAEYARVSELVVCKDLHTDPFTETVRSPGRVAATVFSQPALAGQGEVEFEIFRTPETANFCRYHLTTDGQPDLSLTNISRFLEIGGSSMLVNKARLP